MNKKIIVLVIAIVIAVLIIGIIISVSLLLKIEEDKKLEMQEDALAVNFKEDLTFEFASKVRLSECISYLSGEFIDDFYIDTTSLGNNKVEFQYKSQRGKIKSREFNINIVDTVAPSVYIQNTITVPIGYEKDIAYSVLSGDNADPKPTRQIIGEYDLNKEGRYELKYIITDSSGNKTEKDFILKVVPKDEYNTNTTRREKVLFSDCLNKYKNEKSSLGIDVSKWQGDIDWKAVKNAGAEFAFIRIAYQSDFGGEYKLDKYFEQNIKGATEAGIKVGVYFYSYAKTTEDAIAQADWIHSQIKDYNVEMPIVFDWESWSSFSKSEMSFYDINNIAMTFIKRCEENGHIGALYSSKNYLEKIWNVDEFENIWLAHYTNETNYEGHYNFWQMCDTGRIDGINGAVDIDIWYK